MGSEHFIRFKPEVPFIYYSCQMEVIVQDLLSKP